MDESSAESNAVVSATSAFPRSRAVDPGHAEPSAVMNHRRRTTVAWLIVALLVSGLCINVLLLRPHNSLPCRGNAPVPLCSVQGPPILQLELVWRDNDVVTILAPTADAATTQRNIDDARLGNWYDSLLFVPDYALLLVALAAFAATLGRGFDRWFMVIVVVVVIIAAGDWAENLGISRALDHLEHGGVQAGDARAISNPALVKWSLLPVVLLLISAQFFRARTVGAGALAVATLALAAVIAYGLQEYARERSGSPRCAPTRQAELALPPPACRVP